MGSTSITLASRNTGGDGNGKIGVGDAVLFSGDSTRYLVTAGLSSGATSGTITIASPGLTQALPASATTMTSGPLTSYQRQTANNSATFTSSDIIQSNRDFFADAGFDTNTGVVVGPFGSIGSAVGKNKQGYWATDEGTWNQKFTGTINVTAAANNYWCEVVSMGTTTVPQWQAIGAPASVAAGTQFKATAAGVGTGTIKPAQGRLYVSNNTTWDLAYNAGFWYPQLRFPWRRLLIL